MALPWLGTAFAAVSLLASVDPASAQSVVSRAGDSGNSSEPEWKTNQCDGNDVYDIAYRAPGAEVWTASGSDDAWNDVVSNWKNIDRPGGKLSFTASVARTLNVTVASDCKSLATAGQCTETIECTTVDKAGSPTVAAFYLWNSLAKIGGWHSAYLGLLNSTSFNQSETHLDAYWTSSPEQKTWPTLLADVVTVGNAATYGAFIESQLDLTLYYGRTLFNISDNIDDEVMTFVGNSQPLVQDVMNGTANKANWTPAKDATLNQYMAESSGAAWMRATTSALQSLFSGKDESLEILGSLIADGQLLGPAITAPATGGFDLSENFETILFGLAVPWAWRQPGASAFVMDTGISCDDDPVTKMGPFLSNDTMRLTGTCYGGKQYYLVQPTGKAKDGAFSAPKGLDWLNSNTLLSHGLSKRDFIMGSVITYSDNGKKNVGAIDLTKTDVLSALVGMDLLNSGFMRLPVCSHEEALDSWGKTKPETNTNFPCAGP